MPFPSGADGSSASRMEPSPSQPAAGPPRLGALEQKVMELLWDDAPLSVRGIIDRLSHDPAYTTIATVLGHLEAKGMVSVSRERRATRYSPRQRREEHAAVMMGHVLGTSGDRAASMLHFVEQIGTSDRELLREFLARPGSDGDGPS